MSRGQSIALALLGVYELSYAHALPCLCFHWLLVQDDYGDSCSGAYCHHSRQYLQKKELVLSHVHIYGSASFKVVHQRWTIWALYFEPCFWTPAARSYRVEQLILLRRCWR
jgi:hypothetical protein